MQSLATASGVQTSALLDDMITSNGFHFRKTTWHGIAVIENIETGYYSAADPCRKYGKRFNAWFVNKKTQEFLSIASNELQLSANPQTLQRNEQETNKNPSTRILVDNLIVEIHDVDNELRGSFIHPIIFHSFAEWINPEYAFKTAVIMNLLNERNQLTHRTLEQTIENLNKEIEALKSKIEHKNHVLNELEAELISRADIIDEQNIVIEHKNAIIDEYNKPFNQIDGTSSIYALPKDSSHFQLRIDPFGFGTNGIRNVKLINASFIRNEVIKVLKSESLVTSINREYWIPMNKLDYAFNLINEIKDNRRTEILTPEERNKFIDKKLETFRAGRKSTQTDGLIFEYETIKSHSSYIPWKLIPKTILNTYGEHRKDRGIDAVEIENNEISKIIQIKKHNGGYLRRDELQTFLSKCSQERYSHVSKLLIVKNAKISNKLRRELEAISIEVVSVQ